MFSTSNPRFFWTGSILFFFHQIRLKSEERHISIKTSAHFYNCFKKLLGLHLENLKFRFVITLNPDLVENAGSSAGHWYVTRILSSNALSDLDPLYSTRSADRIILLLLELAVSTLQHMISSSRSADVVFNYTYLVFTLYKGNLNAAIHKF